MGILTGFYGAKGRITQIVGDKPDFSGKMKKASTGGSPCAAAPGKFQYVTDRRTVITETVREDFVWGSAEGFQGGDGAEFFRGYFVTAVGIQKTVEILVGF